MGWLVGVVEAMVAAPLVALGIMNPEGDQAFGKGDQAIMLILGIFLRPSMMILGYIFGIILSYVGIWFVNAGFAIVIPEVQNMPVVDKDTGSVTSGILGGAAAGGAIGGAIGGGPGGAVAGAAIGTLSGMNDSTYGMWSSIFLYFFLLLIYVTTLIYVVSQAFEMIYYLPDKVLRWISGGAASDMGTTKAAQKSMNEIKGGHKTAADKAGQGVLRSGMNAIKHSAKDPKKAGEGESSAEGDEDETSVTGSDEDETVVTGGGKDETSVTGGGRARANARAGGGKKPAGNPDLRHTKVIDDGVVPGAPEANPTAAPEAPPAAPAKPPKGPDGT